MAGWVPTCDSAHSCRLYSAVPLENQDPPTRYSTQSHYPDIELTLPCIILVMQCIWLGGDKYQFDKFESTWNRRPDFPRGKPALYRIVVHACLHTQMVLGHTTPTNKQNKAKTRGLVA